MHRMITMHARPRKTDRQMNRPTNILAIARRFVLTNASRAKKKRKGKEETKRKRDRKREQGRQRKRRLDYFTNGMLPELLTADDRYEYRRIVHSVAYVHQTSLTLTLNAKISANIFSCGSIYRPDQFTPTLDTAISFWFWWPVYSAALFCFQAHFPAH